ncbi:MAG: glycine dehydrogenase, partial [Geothrix sp.]|nr:glycine dehydrogenase [Geothrix sp.]
MRYLPSSPVEDRALLDTIGIPNAEALLAGIPEPLRLARELDLPTQGSEQEVAWQMMGLANKNMRFCAQFLGAGAYDH